MHLAKLHLHLDEIRKQDEFIAYSAVHFETVELGRGDQPFNRGIS